MIKRYVTSIVIRLKAGRTALKGGWLIRPILRTLWKPDKVVLGDNNRGFSRWGWVTVDIVGADYTANFRSDKLPFSDSSCCLVYISHTIEHLPDESVRHLLREIYRILKPDGTVRIACPDLDKVIKAYRDNNLDFFLKPLGFTPLSQAGVGGGKESLLLHNNLVRTLASYADTGAGPIVEKEVVDSKLKTTDKYGFARWCVSLLATERLGKNRPWGHVNAYDFAKLRTMLEEAGFSEVCQSDFRQSAVKELRKACFDLKKHEWISLYVEAMKK